MRKTVTQQLASARKRTEKWRAGRAEKRTPEARQIDKALLTSILLVGRHEGGITLGRKEVGEAANLCVRFLKRDGADEAEAKKAMLRRLAQLSRKRNVTALEDWERFVASPPMGSGEAAGEDA